MLKGKISPTNFIKNIIKKDIKNNKDDWHIHTRFPPEPNGCLHIGHAKSICLNFGLAKQFNGQCNLRFDDTNPNKEKEEYIHSIQYDIRWLGFDWKNRIYYASDYFTELYDFAIQLIKFEKAYVCNLTSHELRNYRGTLTEPGKNSPFRNRSINENLKLFEKMRIGEFPDGSHTLRAKIDMSSPNLNMRDPVLYRILNVEHHRTISKWCIYPMYDYAHPISDYLENITHSICTLEFEDHRPFYYWLLAALKLKNYPKQIEFARLNLTNNVMSKRILQKLVDDGHVNGWDDPRLPTISGLRRRGYTPEAIRDFCERVGVAKSNSIVDITLLEHCVRKDLNLNTDRVMVVLRPLKLIIDNYPENMVEELIVENSSKNPFVTRRKMPFSKILYIEQEDFCENPSKKFFRLAPGQEVRLKYAYIIKCKNFIKDNNGNIIEVHCTYDSDTLSGKKNEVRKVKGTLHWVSVLHAINVEVRLYDYLFADKVIKDDVDFISKLNPNSVEIINNCFAEPSLVDAKVHTKYQFLRHGYFNVDPDTTKYKLIFNRVVSLRDSYTKI